VTPQGKRIRDNFYFKPKCFRFEINLSLQFRTGIWRHIQRPTALDPAHQSLRCVKHATTGQESPAKLLFARPTRPNKAQRAFDASF
jgi:hypothetical protein